MNLLILSFLFLNPLLSFFISQDASPSLAPFLVKNAEFLSSFDFKLPLSENAFLAAELLLPVSPIRDWNIEEPKILARAALVFDTGNRTILFQKDNILESRPIASLTKLMTAIVALENAKETKIFQVSKNAVAQEGEMGNLAVDEKITLKNLLYIMLMTSSNDAAQTIAENIEQNFPADSKQNFVDLMNQKAKTLGLKKTSFKDSSGLDPTNFSSAWELVKIMEETLKQPLLSRIMQTKEIDVFSADKKIKHHLESTNKLLGHLPDIVGGKTGYTEEAGNCMILAAKSPKNEGIIISVVMDSPDRLLESETLINWTKKAYLW